jgi:hypothetical protein
MTIAEYLTGAVFLCCYCVMLRFKGETESWKGGKRNVEKGQT